MEGKMKGRIKVGILGDYDSLKNSHPAANAALWQSAGSLSVNLQIDWLPTPSLLDDQALGKLAEYDCLWASSGSPFKSTQGMLKAIQWARESGKPFIAT
jgi:CTP synthase (UTP-ammonia lyase)